MTKKYFLRVIVFFVICLFLSLSVMTISYAAGKSQTNRINFNDADPTYQYKLHMARGKLCFSEGYYVTSIKNFKKAMDLHPDSVDARDKYTQAILYKKLGIIMELTESG